ncbi:MAG: LemA family protein [Planctomycetaceae bacterium]|nr:LemA family protein [Planctomycetaceae bacterium]
MGKKQILVGGGVAVVVVLFLVFGFVGIGNDLVTKDEATNSAWAQVETVLQRRFDLIPNLVNTVKGYAAHEKEILEEVTRLRSQWGSAATVEEKAKAAGALEGTLSRLLLVAENYPQLKADQAFRDLQHELAGTENRITVERQRYNDSIRTYNTAVRRFPGSLVASIRGMMPKTGYFEAEKPAQSAPKVDFGADGGKEEKK